MAFMRSRPTVTTLLAAAVLALLPVLAMLQYRWLGQVSENERARLQRALLNAMGGVARDVDTEVTKAVSRLDVERLVTSRLGPAVAGGALDVPTGGPRGLVREVLHVERAEQDPAALRVSRCDRTTGSCAAMEWPPAFGDLHQRLSRWFRRGSSDDAEELSRVVRATGVSQSVIVLPIRRPRSDDGGGRTDDDGRANRDRNDRQVSVALLLLDDAWMRAELLPAIIGRHFGPSRESEFQLAVVHRDLPKDVVFGEPGAALDDVTTRPEGWQELFTLRPDGFNDRRSSDEGGLSTNDHRVLVFGRDDDDDDEEWMLVARHREGSLQEAVDNLRRRNLLVSSGILLLMGVAVGLIALTSRRAQRLASQQIEFVAGVSHELRTPVAAIHLAAQNLADGTVTDPSRIQRYGATIQLESQRLRETVERVLQFASTRAGHAIGPKTAVDIRSLVDDVAAQARDIDPAATITVTSPAALPTIVGDPAALRTCVQNVLTNALKYAGKQAQVTIALAVQAHRRGPEVQIAVTDSGPGIPSGELAQVFEPFFRGRNALEQRIQGNGLGLHLVQRFIAAHGGRVNVHSTPGGGSTFVMHLPLGAADTVDGPSTPAPDPRDPRHGGITPHARRA